MSEQNKFCLELNFSEESESEQTYWGNMKNQL